MVMAFMLAGSRHSTFIKISIRIFILNNALGRYWKETTTIFLRPMQVAAAIKCLTFAGTNMERWMQKSKPKRQQKPKLLIEMKIKGIPLKHTHTHTHKLLIPLLAEMQSEKNAQQFFSFPSSPMLVVPFDAIWWMNSLAANDVIIFAVALFFSVSFRIEEEFF